MNVEQKRRMQAEFASGRMHTDNDNAKPDYRRIRFEGERVAIMRRDWLDAVSAGLDPKAVERLFDDYHGALVRYAMISEEYWGRR